MVERFHWVLHDTITQYIHSTGTNWDVMLPFFLMAYRATPQCTTVQSILTTTWSRDGFTKPGKPKSQRLSGNTGCGSGSMTGKLKIQFNESVQGG
jgi:hypothetical protein